MDGYEHPLLYLSGTYRASQETAISGSCQQALVGIHNIVWVWWLYIWDRSPRWCSPWMVMPSVSAPHFVSVTPSMGILFYLLRSMEVSIFWSSFFLSFMCFANCILSILSFWANIHLSMSAYHVSSSVIGLPQSGWYPPDLSKNFIKSLFFNSWVVLHCVNVPHFLYPFLCWGTSGFFPASGYYNKKLLCFPVMLYFSPTGYHWC